MTRKNTPYIVSYILLVLFFFLGTSFYRQSFLAILLVLELLLPVISIGLCYLNVRNLEINTKATAGIIESGHKIPIEVSIKNPSWLPFLNIEIAFEYYNLFYKEEPVYHFISLSAQPRKTTSYTLPFETCFSGMFSISISKVIVTDFLHLKSFTLPYSQTINIPIMPKVIDIQVLTLPQSNEAAEDGDVMNKFGVVSTEFQGVREYIPGDRLQNIHWKMSAKSDDLLVKNPQPVAERLLTLLPELERSSLEDTLQTFYSLGRALIREQETFMVGIFTYSDKTFQFHMVKNVDELQEVLFQMYYASVYKGATLAKTYYVAQNPSAEYLSISGKSIQYYYGEEALK